MSDDKPKRPILREMQEAAPGGIQPFHIDMVCESIVVTPARKADAGVASETAEQQARDLLERMGIEDAQSWTAGDLVELANLITEKNALRLALRSLMVGLDEKVRAIRETLEGR